ncbi:MAG TPA: ATP-binding protein, partial [Blastocatellia bacterium]|nr:ATP-binding protein [Blastocatellia bacterium]
EKPAAFYAVAVGLASKANPQNFGRIARYAERIEAIGKGEFAALLLRDSLRRNPKIDKSPDFIKLVCGPLGKLITGQV